MARRSATSKLVSISLALFAFLFAFLASAASYPFRIERIELDGGAALYAVNDGPATVNAVIDLTNAINFSSNRAWPLSASIPPQTKQVLAFLYPANPQASYQWDYRPAITLAAPPRAAVPTVTMPFKDMREEAQEELRRLLGPAARASMKLSGKTWPSEAGENARPATTSSFDKDALPFLLRTFGTFLSLLVCARLFTYLSLKAWPEAAITAALECALVYGVAVFLGGLNSATWNIAGFKAFLWHHEWSAIYLGGVLLVFWSTASVILKSGLPTITSSLPVPDPVKASIYNPREFR